MNPETTKCLQDKRADADLHPKPGLFDRQHPAVHRNHPQSLSAALRNPISQPISSSSFRRKSTRCRRSRPSASSVLASVFSCLKPRRDQWYQVTFLLAKNIIDIHSMRSRMYKILLKFYYSNPSQSFVKINCLTVNVLFINSRV